MTEECVLGLVHRNVLRSLPRNNRWLDREQAFAACVLGALLSVGVDSPAALGKVVLFLSGLDSPVRDNCAAVGKDS